MVYRIAWKMVSLHAEYQNATGIEAVTMAGKSLNGLSQLDKLIKSQPWKHMLFTRDLMIEYWELGLADDAEVVVGVTRAIYDVRVCFEIYSKTYCDYTTQTVDYLRGVVPGLYLNAKTKYGTGTGVILTTNAWKDFLDEISEKQQKHPADPTVTETSMTAKIKASKKRKVD